MRQEFRSMIFPIPVGRPGTDSSKANKLTKVNKKSKHIIKCQLFLMNLIILFACIRSVQLVVRFRMLWRCRLCDIKIFHLMQTQVKDGTAEQTE